MRTTNPKRRAPALAFVLLACAALPAAAAPAAPRPIAPRGPLFPDEEANIRIFRDTSPSVVYITSLAVVRDPFTLDATEVPQGTGTGFVWDDEGHVVTNFHVIAEAGAVQVTLDDQSVFPARVIGAAPEKDLAVLRVQAPREKLRAIPVGTSADLQVGQRVLAIGNPFGLDHTLTTGIVSALGRSMTSVGGRRIEGVVQTDAAINPGNSGGPLLDSSGRLVGINTAIQSPSGASAGIGFAVPVDTINRVVPQLIQHGRLLRPSLGVHVADDRITHRLGLTGALVVDVDKGSGAALAGVHPTRERRDGRIVLGDVIVGIGANAVKDADDLLGALEDLAPGDVVPLRLRRDGRELEVKVKLGRPE
jgi:S1-C subfamily serine protease